MNETLQKQPAETPLCPKCGKSIFNRRYPNCEFCGIALPESLVLSTEERKQAFEQERIDSDARWQERQKQEKDQSRKSTVDITYSYVDTGGLD